MRNRTLILLVFLLVQSMAFVHAGPISPEEAKQKVLSLMNNGQSHRVRGNAQLTLAYTLDKDRNTSQPLIYTFNISGDNGFIIASADDQAEPILGYCDNGQFNPDSIPPGLKEWMDCWAEEIAWSQANGFTSTDVATPAKAKASIGRLVMSTWGQNSPFYNQCSFDGMICSTGCLTVAMAQLIYFWTSVGKDGNYFRGGCKALPGYTTPTYHLNVGALSELSSFSWSDMTNEVPRTSAAKKAIAQLMRYCGQSIKVDYIETNSPADFAMTVTSLKQNFGYNNDISIIAASSMTTTQWNDAIYNELSEGKPVIITGTDGSIGHAFICDGYDSYSGKFHFNLGWAGYCDGWYAMNAISANGRSYNTNKKAIINVQPLGSNAYAVLSSDGTTLSFYKDSKRGSRSGTIYELNTGTTTPGWSGRTTIKKVVFDSSFASYYPTTTYKWFDGLTSLTTLTGISYLNTSQVTNMAYMFHNCSSLTSIDLSKLSTGKVTNMNYMLSGCSSLTSLDLSHLDMSKVTSFSYMASDCSALRRISLTENFSSVSQSMFRNCTSLASVEIPSSVKSINDYAFYGCSKLTSVTVDLTTPPAITTYVFSNRKNADLYVPAGYKSLYAKANYWKEFRNMYEFGFAPGDVNHDGLINVADVMATSNNIIGNQNVTFFKEQADVNHDGYVNVADISEIVNIVMSNNSK